MRIEFHNQRLRGHNVPKLRYNEGSDLLYRRRRVRDGQKCEEGKEEARHVFSRRTEVIITLRTHIHTHTHALHEEGALKKGGRGSHPVDNRPVIFGERDLTTPKKKRKKLCEILACVPAAREKTIYYRF